VLTELAVKVAVAALLLSAAFLGGVRWQEGADALAQRKADDAAKETLRHVVEAGDKKGIEHAEEVDRLNAELARKQRTLYGLTDGRQCLSAAAVRVLNSTGPGAVPSAASQPASAAQAFATDRDVGDALASCRAEYGKLFDQVNRILDIDEVRTNKR